MLSESIVAKAVNKANRTKLARHALPRPRASAAASIAQTKCTEGMQLRAAPGIANPAGIDARVVGSGNDSGKAWPNA